MKRVVFVIFGLLDGSLKKHDGMMDASQDKIEENK